MEQLGKYEIRGTLGTGGMAIIYRAWDPLLKRDVALKVINEKLLGGEAETVQRFLQEARVAAALTHQNIVVIYELGLHRGSPFIAMEYLPGRDVRDLIAEKAPMNLSQKLHIAIQVARALQCAHSKGVIHRDVKPGNVRVLASGVVKLLDFGIAKITLRGVGLTNLGELQGHRTQTGLLIGSAAYMSPEQAQAKELTPASDVFSFGIFLQELLTYRKPFIASDTLDLLFQIVHGEPEPIGMEAGSIPLDLHSVVRGCLKKSLDERYPSFDPILHRLTRVQQELRQEVKKAPRPLAQIAGPADLRPVQTRGVLTAGDPSQPPFAATRTFPGLARRRWPSLRFAAGFALGLAVGTLLGAFAAGRWPGHPGLLWLQRLAPVRAEIRPAAPEATPGQAEAESRSGEPEESALASVAGTSGQRKTESAVPSRPDRTARPTPPKRPASRTPRP